MKILRTVLIGSLSALCLEASNLSEYSEKEMHIYNAAEVEGNKASEIKNIYLNTQEKCNVAYGKLELTSVQESNIDVYIKGFFEGCTHPHS